MKRRRVKITGLGFVTPAGIGKEGFWSGILEPVSRVTAVRKFPDEAGPFVAAEVKGFKLEHFVPGVNAKRMPRHTQFAVAAAAMALEDAGLSLAALRGRSPLVMIGASLMAIVQAACARTSAWNSGGACGKNSVNTRISA